MHLAGSCVEWDYVNLSLVEVRSPNACTQLSGEQTDRKGVVVRGGGLREVKL